MIRTRRIAVGVPLLVLAGIAGQGMFRSQVTGDLVSARWDGGMNGIIDVIPAATPDATAYAVFWRGCTLHPDYDHRFCLTASGLAPRTAIRAHEAGGVGISLDLSMLSAVFMTSGEDCRMGPCVMFTPASVPLNGTFTVYGGPGSFVHRTTGSDSRTDILPFGGITTEQEFSGNRTRYSAQFTGTVGPLTVPPMAGGANASITIMKGRQSFQTVYPPYPPMP